MFSPWRLWRLSLLFTLMLIGVNASDPLTDLMNVVVHTIYNEIGSMPKCAKDQEESITPCIMAATKHSPIFKTFVKPKKMDGRSFLPDMPDISSIAKESLSEVCQASYNVTHCVTKMICMRSGCPSKATAQFIDSAKTSMGKLFRSGAVCSGHGDVADFGCGDVANFRRLTGQCFGKQATEMADCTSSAKKNSNDACHMASEEIDCKLQVVCDECDEKVKQVFLSSARYTLESVFSACPQSKVPSLKCTTGKVLLTIVIIIIVLILLIVGIICCCCYCKNKPAARKVEPSSRASNSAKVEAQAEFGSQPKE